MFTRAELENREMETLAPYAAKSGLSRGRRYSEEEHPLRTRYQRDRDRVIHSTAFRRLEYKTQVFVNHEGDHYRTRLTHTIEVAQIARSIARALNLNEDLTEAVALAHDLGHTPFGHSGEEALDKLMEEHGGFEHNRHGVRVVETLERRYPNFSGLNLTYEVRESMIKHHTRYDLPKLEEFREYEPDQEPLLEAQVVEVADSVAYDAHDLDDSLSAGLIMEGDLEEVELWQRERLRVREEFGELSERDRRIQTVRSIINQEVTDLLQETAKNLKESRISTSEDVRRAGKRLVSFSSEMIRLKGEMQNFMRKEVYNHFRVVRMVTKAKRFVEDLFHAYLENENQLPPAYKARVAEDGKHRVICDYIAGMTDRFAQDEFIRLFYPYERV